MQAARDSTSVDYHRWKNFLLHDEAASCRSLCNKSTVELWNWTIPLTTNNARILFLKAPGHSEGMGERKYAPHGESRPMRLKARLVEGFVAVVLSTYNSKMWYPCVIVFRLQGRGQRWRECEGSSREKASIIAHKPSHGLRRGMAHGR